VGVEVPFLVVVAVVVEEEREEGVGDFSRPILRESVAIEAAMWDSAFE
jgi:hypothetical protein